MRFCRILFILTALASTGAASGQAPVFVKIPEGIAGDVSGSGSIVVGGLNRPDSIAYRWEGGTATSLGLLPGAAIVNSRALGVSADGAVAVGRSFNSAGLVQAFRWEGEMTPLPFLSTDSTGSAAHAASADGRIIVGIDSAGATRRAVQWIDSGIQELPDLPDGVDEALAFDVAHDGSMIVGIGNSERGQEAVIWRNGVPQSLGSLGASTVNSSAFAVSPDGRVIVGTSGNERGVSEAFRWEDDAMRPLGTVGGSTYALALSADGMLIGGRSTSGGPGIAFLWDAVHGMRDLNQVLPSEYGLDLQGVLLTECTAISDDGRTLVGGGFNAAGDAVGWVAVIPAPSSFLTITGLFAATCCRRRTWQGQPYRDLPRTVSGRTSYLRVGSQPSSRGVSGAVAGSRRRFLVLGDGGGRWRGGDGGGVRGCGRGRRGT